MCVCGDGCVCPVTDWKPVLVELLPLAGMASPPHDPLSSLLSEISLFLSKPSAGAYKVKPVYLWLFFFLKKFFRRKSARDLLPAKPVEISVEPWWVAQAGFITEDDIRVRKTFDHFLFMAELFHCYYFT